jgi:hypothetical protein
MDRPGVVTQTHGSASGAEADSLRRSAHDRWSVRGAKEGARGGSMGSPTQGGEEWIGQGS